MCYTKYVIKGRKTHQTGKELIAMTNTNTNKVTYTSALSYVLTNCDLPAEIATKLETLMEQTAKRNSTENRKPTKAQRENAELSEVVAEVLADAGKALTVTEIMQADSRFTGLSNQKVSAVLRGMGDRVVKATENRKSVFRLA